MTVPKEPIQEALHHHWERVLRTERTVEVWAPWEGVVTSFLQRYPDARRLPLLEGSRAGWVPWAGPRFHRILPLTPEAIQTYPDLPSPPPVWENRERRVWGRMPTREIHWPTRKSSDLYALIVLLLPLLPSRMTGRWFALYRKHPQRFTDEVTEYLRAFFQDPQNRRALQDRFPHTFSATSRGWRWVVPDVPAYVDRIEHYPPETLTEVGCLEEHLPVILHRLARLRPLDVLDASEPPPWPPEPRGVTVSPRIRKPHAWFHGGWVWIPGLQSPARPVCGGRNPLPGLLPAPPCPDPLPPPQEKNRYILQVNGLAIPLDVDADDLPGPLDVERIRVEVRERGTRSLEPPPPLRLADVVRMTPEEDLWRLSGWTEALEKEGLIPAPHTREIHADIPFAALARRILTRFLGGRVQPLRPYRWSPGDLVPLVPLLPQELVEIFPRHRDLSRIQRLWELLLRRWVASLLPAARVQTVTLEIRYRRNVLARTEVFTRLVDPGFALAAPPPLHPGLPDPPVPVRLIREQVRPSRSHRLAHLMERCPETPLRELLGRIRP